MVALGVGLRDALAIGLLLIVGADVSDVVVSVVCMYVCVRNVCVIWAFV